MPISLEEIKNISDDTGVYLMKDDQNKVVYVGKARSLKKRVWWYFKSENSLPLKTTKMIEHVNRVDYITTVSELDALILEAYLIKKHKPKYNVIWRDDKRPLYIKITNDEFPRVTTVRREDDKKSVYFGPFPSARTTRYLLRRLRYIFPYCSQKLGKKACFYSHLKLCDPCPSDISRLPKGKKDKETKRYQRSIRRIIDVLSGKTNSVVKKIQAEMKNAADKENFEYAQKLHRQIEALKMLRQLRFSAYQYNNNPNLTAQVIKKQLSDLKKWLTDKSLLTIPDKLSRIEAIDVSNIHGKNAAGSLVVFLDGQPAKDHYRRFKIKLAAISDTAMIAEILKRRLKHKEWQYPDLLLIDGGKGRVAAALSVFN